MDLSNFSDSIAESTEYGCVNEIRNSGLFCPVKVWVWVAEGL